MIGFAAQDLRRAARGMPVTIVLRLFATASLAALAACSAAPRPLMVPITEDGTYGFTQEQVAPEEYEIAYYGPMIYTQITIKSWLERISNIAKQTSQDLALWRAAELAAGKGFSGVKVSEAGSNVRHYIVGRDYENVPVGVFQNVIINRYEYASWTYYRGEAKLTVELTDETGEGVFNAAETAAALKTRYERAVNGAIMADTYYYFGPDAWFQGYDTEHEEAPLFESVPVPKPGPPGKPLGQPYYIP